MAPTKLTDDWLMALAADLSDPAANAATTIIGVTLMGSHSRGTATPYSDVDVECFAERKPEGADFAVGRHTLRLLDDRIVSVTTTSLAARRAELGAPEDAVWAVEPLRQARILLDPDGALATLLAEAHAFQWAPLQPQADAFASETLTGLAENAGKVMGGLACSDDATCAFAALELLVGLTRAVIVQRGVLLSSENGYFARPQEAVGRDSAWARTLRLAAGLEAPTPPTPPTPAAQTAPGEAPSAPPLVAAPAQAQALAVLRLYRETAALLDPIIRPEDRAVIAHTLRLLAAFV